MFCDDCGDQTVAAKPLLVVYPSGKQKKAFDDIIELLQRYGYDVLPINICPECWDKNFKDSRKRQVASMLRILKEE